MSVVGRVRPSLGVLVGWLWKPALLLHRPVELNLGRSGRAVRLVPPAVLPFHQPGAVPPASRQSVRPTRTRRNTGEPPLSISELVLPRRGVSVDALERTPCLERGASVSLREEAPIGVLQNSRELRDRQPTFHYGSPFTAVPRGRAMGMWAHIHRIPRPFTYRLEDG